MQKTAKYVLAAFLVAVIALGVAYEVVYQSQPANGDNPNALLASNPNQDAGTAPNDYAFLYPANIKADPPLPHQYIGFFPVTSYTLLIYNTTSPLVADLELTSQNSTQTPPATCVLRFTKNTADQPADTAQMLGNTYLFISYRPYTDLQNILGLLQNKDLTVSFGMPAAGPAYPQQGVTIIAKTTNP